MAESRAARWSALSLAGAAFALYAAAAALVGRPRRRPHQPGARRAADALQLLAAGASAPQVLGQVR
jgi:hypothetical protein